ncbi:MAG: APC family permease [Clostridiales bacterium]|nr:APC family permease [Clostridiales bacterium]
MTELRKKYGLFTCIAMITGIVIGSGVFFKSGTVLSSTGGNMYLSIAAWLVGGLIMLVLCYTFCVIAGKHPNSPGLMGYADDLIGKKYSYFIGWFWATMYAPVFSAVVSWVSANYTVVLFGLNDDGAVWMIAMGYMLLLYTLNTLAPKISGKFQVSALVIKLIPLILMAIIGTIVGLVNGTTVDNFGTTVVTEAAENPFFTAIIACLFAYDGWIVVTSIVPEVKNAKKTVPLALLIGAIIIVGVYIVYFIGIASTMPTIDLITGNGNEVIKTAFSKIFSNVGGTLLFVFVIISCLGTANGMTMSSTRSMYALANKRMGIAQDTMGHVTPATNMPANSGLIGLLLSGVWLVVWYFSITRLGGAFDISELPIVFLYAMLVPIFVATMHKHKDLHWFNRFVAPIVSIGCTVFLIIALVYSHKWYVLWFLGVFAVVQIVGIMFMYIGKPQQNDYTEEKYQQLENNTINTMQLD